MQRQSTQEELLRLLQSEQERWARDRRYEEFLNEGTCCRAFFDDVREARVHSHIEKLQSETGTTARHHRKQQDLLGAAKEYFGGKGKVFNRGPHRNGARARNCRTQLLDALNNDGRVIPENMRNE